MNEITLWSVERITGLILLPGIVLAFPGQFLVVHCLCRKYSTMGWLGYYTGQYIRTDTSSNVLTSGYVLPDTTSFWIFNYRHRFRGFKNL